MDNGWRGDGAQTFTTLHSFTATRTNASAVFTNSQGVSPDGGLLLAGGILYGTTFEGGINGRGTLFALNTNGTGFTNLHNFMPVVATTNNDGANPEASLILSGSTLYGTTGSGGSGGVGTVFAINTNGAGFTNLHNFVRASEGASLNGSLVLSGNTLYGTAPSGGGAFNGTVFALNTDGTGFTVLHNFTALNSNTNNDGAHPQAGLVSAGNLLYGTANSGGNAGSGRYSAFLSCRILTIAGSGTNVVLTWPTNAAGFALQSTANLTPPATWNPVSPAPTVISNQYEVTNGTASAHMFYRLSQ